MKKPRRCKAADFVITVTWLSCGLVLVYAIMYGVVYYLLGWLQ